MKIAEFISEQVLRPRLRETGCLVVYDPGRRMRGLCLGLADEKVRVVDASEDSIASRQAAMQGLRALASGAPPRLEGLLVYVPARRPLDDAEKQVDPFAVVAECGAVFPDGAGDEFEQICLKAKPDYATEIRRVFAAEPNGPAYGVIDAIGGGVNWPQLKAALKVESAREILVALLVPTVEQKGALKSSQGWTGEARDFLRATLGLTPKTRAKTWDPLAEEVWRYLL